MRRFLLLFLLAATGHAGQSLPLRFAYRDPVGAAGRIYLQGEEAAKPAYARACGPAGSDCACELLDAGGKLLERTKPSAFAYERAGNYFRCTFSGTLPAIGRVRLTGFGGSASPPLAVRSTLTLADLMDPGLNLNRVRSIYRYECDENYLEKRGTTPTSFDCTNQAELCDGTGNFCLLETHAPYFLYEDALQGNFLEKPADRLYGAGGDLCGLRIRQLDCVSDGGTPVARFGLYAGNDGPWTRAILLPPAPDRADEFVGFGAEPSPTTGECPPGLVKELEYSATLDTQSLIPSSNLRSGEQARDVVDPSLSPTPFQVQRTGGGTCNGMACTMPQADAGVVVVAPFSSAGHSVFCAIPASLLAL